VDLFSAPRPEPPLADRVRPRSFDEFAGQTEIVATLRALAQPGKALPSILLWGPPGTGKTTLARLLASAAGCAFAPFSAVTSGIKEVRETIEAARARGGRMILFVDEIHRFNRAQQDAFLPHVEDGTITLLGATTENPSFEVNAPLLSRCRVFRLSPLTDAQVRAILDRGLAGLPGVTASPGALDAIAGLASGDARAALTLLETAAALRPAVDEDAVKRAAQSRALRYDKNRDEHYDVVSAYIKSMRGSDPDAALYWLARMLEAGEDPLFVARRMVIFASEDVGNADPAALQVAVAAMQAAHFVGMPEAAIPLAHATAYCACALKSNASYLGYLAAKEAVETSRQEPVPLHLRNAVTGLMRREGYGQGYKYPHDYVGVAVDQAFLPPGLAGRRFYAPNRTGVEARLLAHLEAIRRARADERRNKPAQ
jgi:putative ATPase